MRRALTLAVLVLGSLAGAPRARAVAYQDPASDLTVEVTAPDATVCFIRPAGAETDPDTCLGAEAEAAAKRMPPGQRLVAVVRLADWGYWVTAHVSDRPDRGPLSRARARDFVAGVLRAAKDGKGEYAPAEPEPELLVVNGLQVIRYGLTAGDRSSPASDVIAYSVVGRDSVVTLSFLTDAGHLESMRELARKTIATLAMPPVKEPATWEDSWPDARTVRLGRLVGRVLSLGAVCLVVILLVRAARRRGSKPRSGRKAW
jgi:hypothetical protein